MFQRLKKTTEITPRGRRRLSVLAVLILVLALPYAAFEGWRAYLRFDPEWRFVEDVLLEPITRGGEHLVARWATPLRVTLIGVSAEDQEFVEGLIVSINGILDGSGLYARLADPLESNLEVHFVHRARFDSLATSLGAKPFPPATGFYLLWPNQRMEISSAAIAVGTDMPPEERQATIVHEFAHVLGLRGHSNEFPDSAVFANDGQRSTATEFAPMDRKSLRLLYMNLSPRDGWLSLRTAFSRHWRDR